MSTSVEARASRLTPWIGVAVALAIAGLVAAPASPFGPPPGSSHYGHGGGDLGAQAFEAPTWRACVEILNQSTMAVEDRDRSATLFVQRGGGEEVARAHIERATDTKTRHACVSPGEAGIFEVKLDAPWTSTWRIRIGP